MLTATKRLSHNFLVLAPTRTGARIGNYPGLFQASNGQLDPNISTQYDFRELLVNRNGPLPNDRPHNFKLAGRLLHPARQPTASSSAPTFNALSGTPIEVLARTRRYGRARDVHPAARLGRPHADDHAARPARRVRRRSARARARGVGGLFNVVNQQAVTTVDEQYTTSA